jgi:hypothetical protein
MSALYPKPGGGLGRLSVQFGIDPQFDGFRQAERVGDCAACGAAAQVLVRVIVPGYGGVALAVCQKHRDGSTWPLSVELAIHDLLVWCQPSEHGADSL